MFLFRSCTLTHLMFELAPLNDRAASVWRPQAPLSQGFKGPATGLLSAVKSGETGNVWRRDNLYGTEPMAACLFDRLINGKASLEKNAAYQHRDQGRRNLPLSPGHQGLEPGLL